MRNENLPKVSKAGKENKRSFHYNDVCNEGSESMEWTTLLQKAIDYMEAHMLEEINYEDVARQINMSSYNFHRTFRFMAGMTANEYIRNRRLSMAG